MATIKDVVRDTLGSLDTDVAFLQAVKWAENRWQQMANRVRFKVFRQIGELSIPAKYTTGTIDVTNASTAVSGTDTEWATFPAVAANHYDYFIRIGATWYQIGSVTDDTTLALSTAFVGDTATGLSYTIVKRFHTLIYNARWIGDFVLPRLRMRLDTYSLDRLNAEAPGRELAGGYPTVVAEATTQRGVTPVYKRVELYPYATNAEILQYVWWSWPLDFDTATYVLETVDPYVLKEGILIDLYRYLKARAYKQGKIEEGNSWRNDEMTQQTRWERIIQEAVKADRGVDDATFILQTGVSGPTRGGAITDAHDYVYSRWSRP